MIINKPSRKITIIIIIVLSFVAFCFDLANNLAFVATPGTFRAESEFDAISGATAKIAIVPSDFSELASPVARNIDPSYEQIEAMVRKAIELQGGIEWLIKEGNKVVIKVNLCSQVNGSGIGEVTDVRVTKAVIKIIDEIAPGKIPISVIEGTPRLNDDPAVTEPITINGKSYPNVWQVCGYQSLLTDSTLNGVDLKLVNINGPVTDLIEITIPDSKKTAAPHNGKYHIHKAIVEADVYIDIPVMKIHNTGITNALKNQIGIAPSTYYGYNKEKGVLKDGVTKTASHLYHDQDAPRRWTEEEIVDLSTCAGIDFVVVDAIMCLQTYKQYSTADQQVRFNTILAGSDPVAIDHVATKLFGLNPDDIDHIVLAEKVGLGTNNSDLISVVGATIDDVKKIVKKNNDANGKFGRSNRTWILSKPFTGKDIATKYITNEEDISPVAGVDGWSQPIYFFDDRISLENFYKGATNIVTYAFSNFDSPIDYQAELWLGYGESIWVYINDSLTYKFSGNVSYANSSIDIVKPKINIKKGKNKLLVKTLNTAGEYSFALNICEVQSNVNYSGNRIAGLKFYLDSAGSATSAINKNKIFLLKAQVYPNPVKNAATIEFKLPYKANTLIDIYDLGGKRIANIANKTFEAGIHKFNIRISDYPILKKGMYFLSIKSGGENKAIKIKID